MRFFRKKPQPPRPPMPQPIAAHFDPPQPDEPLFLIGDIHGEITALNALLARAEADFPDHRIICVGDFVDRGTDSAAVLARLVQLSKERPNTVFIRGNHEDMMLAFLDDPETEGNRWLRHGGLQTMASFDGPPLGESNSPEALRAGQEHLKSRIQDEIEPWLRGLARSWTSGNVTAVHAAADPSKPIDEQQSRHLTWGHRDFGLRPRSDGMWIVHGHNIVDFPGERNGVISIDTGAYATGRLTGAIIANGTTNFVQASRG